MSGAVRDTGELAVAFLVYNIIAFGFQPVIGYICDIRPGLPAGMIGCAAVAAGVLALPLFWPAMLLCAAGNALFHVEGGIDSLVLSEGKMSRSGVFVSTGALGVVLGTMYGKAAGAPILLPLALLAASAVLIALFKRMTPAMPAENKLKVSSALPFVLVLSLALVSIVIRAYVGASLPLEWRTGSVFLSVLPAAAAFAGKAAGGFIGDALGARRAGAAALALSIPLLTLGAGSPVLSFIGITLFNMTMPITLCVVASGLPRNSGLAFGLTTLALLCGTTPTFMFRLSGAAVPIVIAALTAVSAVCVLLSARDKKGISYDTSKETQQHTV